NAVANGESFKLNAAATGVTAVVSDSIDVNILPTITGLLPSALDEDVQTDLDLSAVVFADEDPADSITATFEVDSGLLFAIDGDTTISGVTITGSNAPNGSASVSFAGSPGDLNTYFNTVGKLQFLTAEDSITPVTLTVTPNDGTADGAPVMGTISINPINDAPTITGPAVTTVVAGSLYDYTPTSNEVDGDTVSYMVASLPAWASFDPNTGRILNRPTEADIGIYSGIVVTVTDTNLPNLSDSLGPFSITVETAVVTGATLDSIELVPLESPRKAGDNIEYRILGKDANGEPVGVVTLNTVTVTFTHSDGSTLDAGFRYLGPTAGIYGGVVRPIRTGDWTLAVTHNGVTQTSIVNVEPGPPARLIYNTSPPASIDAGDSLDLTSYLEDAFGNKALPGQKVAHEVVGGSVNHPLLPATDRGDNEYGYRVSLTVAGDVTIKSYVNSAVLKETPLTVNAGPVSRNASTLTAPEDIVPGETFNFTLRLRDRFGNAQTKLDTSSLAISLLESPGTLEIKSFGALIRGTMIVTAVYHDDESSNSAIFNAIATLDGVPVSNAVRVDFTRTATLLSVVVSGACSASASPPVVFAVTFDREVGDATLSLASTSSENESVNIPLTRRDGTTYFADYQNDTNNDAIDPTNLIGSVATIFGSATNGEPFDEPLTGVAVTGSAASLKAVDDGSEASPLPVLAGTPRSISVLSNDELCGSVFVTAGKTEKGSTQVVDNQIVYSVNDGETGKESFEYRVASGDEITTAMVHVEITTDNQLPVAFDDEFDLLEDAGPTIMDVLSNDTDADDHELEVVVQQEPANGQLVVSLGQVEYTPNANFFGQDSFTYKARDEVEQESENTASVTIMVTSVNDAPTVTQLERQSLVACEVKEIDLLSLASDVEEDKDDLRIESVVASRGIASIENKKLKFALYELPKLADQMVVDYTIADGKGGSVMSSVVFQVDNVEKVPVFTKLNHVTADATAFVTEVDLGDVKAEVGSNKQVSLSATPDTDEFTPGITDIEWRAEDQNNGNCSSVEIQRVSVDPLVSFHADQTVVEGGTASVSVVLNGESPTYPVKVPLTITGEAANNEDITWSLMQQPEITIEFGTSVTTSIVVNQNTDAGSEETTEPEESFTVGFGPDVRAGQKSTHTVTIPGEFELAAPVVSLEAKQAGKLTRTVTRGDGLVELIASFSHPLQDSDEVTFAYEWSTDTELMLSSFSRTESIDPRQLREDIYTVTVEVTARVGANAFNPGDLPQTVTGQTSLAFKVTASSVLDCQAGSESRTKDTDGDGKSDCDEGEGDDDGDGIANYLDSDKLPGNVLQTGDGSAPLETEPGLKLKLSNSAFASGKKSAKVDNADVDSDEETTVKSIVGFTVEGLEKGGSVTIVLPQANPVPSDNAVYRKLIDNKWQDFVATGGNAIASVKGARNKCPGPADSTYKPGLALGNWCVRLTMVDGGANDGDGLINGSVEDPGGVGVPISDNVDPIAADDSISIRMDAQETVDVLSNDTDENGDLLSVIDAEANFGTVSFEATQVVYTAKFGFVGSDTIFYSISDGQGGNASAVVEVSVFANQVPVAVDDSASVESGNSVTIDVLSNDSDPDQDALSLVSGSAENGSVTVSDDGQLTYTPMEGFTGTDTISYMVQDAFGDTVSATVTVTVSEQAAPTTPPATKSGGGGGGSLGWFVLALMLIGIQRRLTLNRRLPRA
ncbi:MAG: tandem-95 repeat protein, partial [Gammaproteobacteria bacterium]|nr:tandem-95 repeat protein [Gammaproteobacteria bacterium]